MAVSTLAPERRHRSDTGTRLFAIPAYRRLFTAQVVALLGTGLATVAIGLLAYDLAGPDAAAVLATALTVKMVMYVVIAPIAGAYADRVPRRLLLTALDVVRATVVLALPFVTEVWQIYVLIGVLQAASAAFTPTFQAVIPDIVTNEAAYTRALSASQVASTMESLISPVLAAVALWFMSFDVLFVGTSIGFVLSAVLVLRAGVPDATPSDHDSAWARLTSGIVLFARVPQLRSVLGLNAVVAAGGSIVVVNTVNYVRDRLGGSQADVAWMLAASGGGTLVAALLIPRVLDRVSERVVMLTGAGVMLGGVAGAIAMVATDVSSAGFTAPIWTVIGAGMALVITPTGRVIRSSATTADLPSAFAAQFSLSHLAWLVAYPIAGWVGTGAGLTTAWSILGGLAVVGAATAVLAWPHTTAPSHQPRVMPAESRTGALTLVAGQCNCSRTA